MSTRDDEFKPFLRTDYTSWSYVATFFTHFFFIPRFIISYGFCFLALLGGFIATIGHPRGTQMGPARQWLNSFAIGMGGRLCMLVSGCVWVSKKNIMVDYSGYLGPEWNEKEAKFEGAATYVSNH